MRQIEWSNRLLLECYQNPITPLFVTLTYDNERLPKNKAESLKYTQKWLKRLRKKHGKLRYFLVTERGSKRGRLHHHLILWSEELIKLKPLERWRTMHKLWGEMRLDVQEVRTKHAFLYTAKYILKNITDEKTESTIGIDNKTKKYRNKGRLASWSQSLGKPGIERWKYLTNKNLQRNPDKIPCNYINMIFKGKLTKAYIPKDTYMKYIKEIARQDDIIRLSLLTDEGIKWLIEKSEDIPDQFEEPKM